MFSILQNRYISWVFTAFFVLTVIANELYNTSICWILFSIFLLSSYGLLFYFARFRGPEGQDKLHRYSLFVFAVVFILFGYFLTTCLIG